MNEGFLFIASFDHAKASQVFSLGREIINKALKKATKQAFKWGSREAAKAVSRLAKIPYSVARRRIKSRFTSDGRGQIWFGLNPVSIAFIAKAMPDKSFTNSKLNDHYFKREGKKRTPLIKLEQAIQENSSFYIEGELLDEVERKLYENVFTEIDKLLGREAGTSQAIYEQ